MVLKAAFATGGSPVPSLEPADDQTAFLLERIREGWGEGVPAVRVVTPALDRNRLLARVKAIDDCADRDHPAAQRFHKVLASEPERIADWAGIMLVDGEQCILPSLQQFAVEPNYALSTLRLSLLGELGDWSNRATAQLCESRWPHGDCPVCGASPALAESRGLSSGGSCAATAAALGGRATGSGARSAARATTMPCARSLLRKIKGAAGWCSATAAGAGSKSLPASP